MKKRLAKKMMKRKMAQAVEHKVIESEAIVVEHKAESKAIKPAESKTVDTKPAKVKAAKEKVTTETKSTEAKAAKAAGKVNIYYQFSNRQIEQQDIISMIKAQWKAQGNKVKDLNDLVVYLKPEEQTAYYVINASVKGSVAISN